MATPPPLSPPRLGDPINRELAYVKRASADRQDEMWNSVLADVRSQLRSCCGCAAINSCG